MFPSFFHLYASREHGARIVSKLQMEREYDHRIFSRICFFADIIFIETAVYFFAQNSHYYLLLRYYAFQITRMTLPANLTS